MAQRDLYGECNDKGMPLSEFSSSWCSRCMSPDCTRSLHGKTRFDERTTSWVERLFQNPSRMSQEDPRYANIAGKQFVSVDAGRMPQIRDWCEPQTLGESRTTEPQIQGNTRVVEPIPLTEPARNLGTPQVVEPIEISPPLVPEAPARPVIPLDVLRNAPDQSGTILPGGTTPSKRDAWEPGEKVIPVGGTFRFGGRSGV